MSAFWRRPVTERFALVIFALVPTYLIVNLGFSIYCVPTLSAGYSRGICTVGRSFGFLDQYIPAIWRGVNVFTDADNASTANVVGAVTEFIWGSALCCAAIMVVLSYVLFLIFGAAEKARWRPIFEEQIRRGRSERGKKARWIALLGFFTAFLFAFWGTDMYSEIYRNAHNIYVQPSDFLEIILELSFVMFGVALFTGNWARSLILRSMNVKS